ncbi:MAG: NUDIX domain-containing protein [Patescibacteria group bacterium]|jgi:ADP-ribose pyrophosphatase YjhB (NUDIX family)
MKKQIVCHDMDGNLYKVDSTKLTFRPSVYGILIERNKVLLFNQKNGYDFPGGGFDITETIDQALTREFFEETGLKIKGLQLLSVHSSFYYSRHLQRGYNAVLIYYLCRRISGKLSNSHMDGHEKDYAIGPEWVDLKNIKKIKFQNPVDSVKLIQKAFKK